MSPIEAMFLEAWTKRTKIPLVREYRVDSYSIDFVHLPTMLAIELDGMRGHSTPADIEKDRRRQRELEDRGWTFVRFGGREVFLDVNACVAQVLGRLRRIGRICERCLRDRHDKCLDRGDAVENAPQTMCLCGCWRGSAL